MDIVNGKIVSRFSFIYFFIPWPFSIVETSEEPKVRVLYISVADLENCWDSSTNIRHG